MLSNPSSLSTLLCAHSPHAQPAWRHCRGQRLPRHGRLAAANWVLACRFCRNTDAQLLLAQARCMHHIRNNAGAQRLLLQALHLAPQDQILRFNIALQVQVRAAALMQPAACHPVPSEICLRVCSPEDEQEGRGSPGIVAGIPAPDSSDPTTMLMSWVRAASQQRGRPAGWHIVSVCGWASQSHARASMGGADAKPVLAREHHSRSSPAGPTCFMGDPTTAASTQGAGPAAQKADTAFSEASSNWGERCRSKRSRCC